MKIALVDDDINFRKSLELNLVEFPEFEVVSFKNAKDALKKIDDSFDLIVTDINMPEIDGVEMLRQLGGKYEAIVITANATLSRAIDALRLGAKDFFTKPFEIDDLIKAIKRSSKVQKVSKATTTKIPKELMSSKAIDKLKQTVLKAAFTDVTMMLLGESGVGKEVFANFIHKNSPRKDGPFVAINMAAIPEQLLESELFGHEKGAFTDACESREGKFEQANKGTIFLDEITEMPYTLQAKLLRVLQEREITRLGSNKARKVDVRIVSATNANLDEKIKKGEFREDLYYRLNTFEVFIPPLRERIDEIKELANLFLEEANQSYKLGAKSLSPKAIDELEGYDWPGNIRELKSKIERAYIVADGLTIEADDLFLHKRR